MKYASLGTVSHGTMRTEDLLDAFSSALEDYVQRNAEEWCSDAGRAQRDGYLSIIGDAREVNPDSEDAGDMVATLGDALQEFAPPYAYFGSHPGDGSDYGFWVNLDDVVETFDGLEVSDTSEIPDDYSGEALHVNDHGNATLYCVTDGQCVEVWGVV